MTKRIKAWHFLSEDRRLRYGDRREVLAGNIYKVAGPPALCQSGLHASKKPINALDYALGPVICRVLVGGDILISDDKIVGTTREVLAMADATNILREFARWCISESAWNTSCPYLARTPGEELGIAWCMDIQLAPQLGKHLLLHIEI